MLDVLFDVMWKSLIIAALGMAGLQLMTKAAARERVVLAVMTLGLIAALPLLASFLPAVTIEREVPIDTSAVLSPVMVPVTDVQSGGGEAVVAGENAPAATTLNLGLFPVLTTLYVCGIAALAGRLVVGLIVLRSKTATARVVMDPRWNSALRKVRAELGVKRQPRLLCAADDCPPISYGIMRPVILIDRALVDRPQDAPAILRHEMAHIAHHDFATRLLSKAVRALFWINPLVWMVDRDLEASQEEAADDMAVKGMKRTDYAQALLNAARDAKGAWAANGAGSAHLEGRLSALLSGEGTRPARRTVIAGTALASLVIAAPVAALQFRAATPVAAVPPALPAPPAPPVPMTASAPPAAPVAPAAVVAPPPAPAAPTVQSVPVPPPPPAAPAVISVSQASGPTVTMMQDGSTRAETEKEREARLEAEEERREAETEREVEMAMAEVEREMERVEIEVERALGDIDERTARVTQAAFEMNEMNEERIRDSVAHGEKKAREAMARGAKGMLRGADGMEKGADKMEKKGRRMVDDRNYREQIIAKQAKRGETVTHAQLIEAGRDMIEGAEDMRQGAEEMREAAEEMRSQDI